MKFTLKRFAALLFWLTVVLSVVGLPALADETESVLPVEEPAVDLTGFRTITDAFGFPKLHGLVDKSLSVSQTGCDGAYVTVTHELGIGSVYISFAKEYGTFSIKNNDTGETLSCGAGRFLNAFVDVQALFGNVPNSVTVTFDNGAPEIAEIAVYSPGRVPDSVQKWRAPLENETDLLLFSTHGDDEQLFLMGILPYYDAELDYEVLVVYMTDHTKNYGLKRKREMLAGLWAVGVDTYPVFGPFEDFLCPSKESAYSTFAVLGHSHEELMGYVVEQIRRFKPKVVVGHDFDGEYGHGQHMAYADLLANSLEITQDASAYPELAEKYGTWDVPKAYFHLYPENPVVMDWDQPLERFGGETAFQVSIKRGFAQHVSQLNAFYGWFWDAKTAADIKQYNPRYYGLFRSTVGEDVLKNDFFENVTTHAQDRIAQEEARLKAEEEARQKAEEEARLKAEEEARLKAEEEARAAAEAEKKAAEAAAQEAARLEREKRIRTQRVIAAIAAVLTVLCCGFIALRKKKKVF